MLPSGIIYHSFLVRVAPEFTLKILAKGCCIAHVLVAPSVITVLLLKGSTREVTTECSAPVSTINLLVSLLLLFLLWAHGSQGWESLVLLSLSLFMPGLWSPPLGILLVAFGLSHLGHLFFQCPFSLQQAHWSFARGFWVSPLWCLGVSLLSCCPFPSGKWREGWLFSLFSFGLPFSCDTPIHVDLIGNLY